MTLQKEIRTLSELQDFAKEFAESELCENLVCQQKQKIILFEGVLGAGKTTFIGEILRHWFIRREGEPAGKSLKITSPTFPIIHVHEFGQSKALHVDLYRLKSLDEAQETGLFDEIISSHLVLIEWASKVPETLEIFRSMAADPPICVNMKVNDTVRTIETRRGFP